MAVTDQQRAIIWTVVARFLDLQKPTSRKELVRKFKNPDALNELSKRPFFGQIDRDVYLPLPLAFHYCGDAGFLARARQATELALRVLQNLDEAHPEKEKTGFTLEEFIEHAARICDPKPDEAVLMLGLHLSTYFGVFSQWSGDAARLHTPTTFFFHEDIVTIDPAQAWDEYITKFDAPPAEMPRLAFEVDPHELGLDVTNFGSTAARRAAVRPTGEYDYHAEIKRVSERLCLEGNFRQAVLDAFIQVIATVKERTALPYDGDDLMNRAFSPDNRVPLVQFNPLRNNADRDEQRGIWNLFKGIVGLRNFKAHIVSDFDDPHRAHEYLALASLLMRLLDMATKNAATQQPPTPPASAPIP